MMPSGWRLRVSFTGKVILQRAHRHPGFFPGDWDIHWKDAKSTDIQEYLKACTNQKIG